MKAKNRVKKAVKRERETNVNEGYKKNKIYM